MSDLTMGELFGIEGGVTMDPLPLYRRFYYWKK
jgi:hypothetical protein